MSSTTKKIDALKLFNEKAKKLADSDFVKQIDYDVKNIVAFVVQKKDGRFEYVNICPTSEAIAAFVLTFRFFIQDNERSSFANLDRIYSKLSVSEEIRNQFRDARQKLNEYLDSAIVITEVELRGKKQDIRLTRRKLLNVFIYGGYAHANRQYKKLFDEWMNADAISSRRSLLESFFITTLLEVSQKIKFVENLNSKVIGALDRNSIQPTKRSKNGTPLGVQITETM